jgi:hypothetical protein
MLCVYCFTCSMACYKLEEYETAQDAFEAGHDLVGDKNPQYSIWAQKCRNAIAGGDLVWGQAVMQDRLLANSLSAKTETQATQALFCKFRLYHLLSQLTFWVASAVSLPGGAPLLASHHLSPTRMLWFPCSHLLDVLACSWVPCCKLPPFLSCR